MAYSQFSYVQNPSGTLDGEAFVQQTEDAINALGEQTYELTQANASLTVQIQQAVSTANSALSTANSALSNSQSTQQQLETLSSTVSSYDSKITQAVSQSSSAVQTASAAQASAQNAQTAAETAQTAAESAASQAQQAQTAAQDAQQQASASQTAAEAAQDQAENASNIAQNAQQQAQIAAQSAQNSESSAGLLAASSVMVTVQDFSEEKQAQARTNIGAAASADAALTGTTTAEALSVSGMVTATGGFTGNLIGTASQATADGNGNNIVTTYATIADTYTKAQVDAKVSSVYRFAGSVATYDDLPTSGQTVGDTYNVEDTGANYAWTGSAWDKLSETVDLSGYLTISSAQGTYLTIATAQSTYLTQSAASTTYLTQTNASNTYLTKTGAASTYLTASDAEDQYLRLSGGTMTGALILNANPTAALGAATKQYVDSAVSTGTSDAVLFVSQSLSSAQQTQARSNIGALGDSEKAASATTADKLSANRTISLTGAVTGSASTNLSGNVTISTSYTVMDGATSSTAGAAGAVPAPSAGYQSRFLRGDGTWASPSNNLVLQTPSTANGNYPLLLKETTGTSTTTDGSIFDTNIYANPSTGVVTANGFHGPLTGNASTASEWATARTISLSGDATGSVSIDGSANATLNLTIANGSVTNGMLASSSVTFSKVASGDVATQAEAEAGTSNSAFMTPLRVAQAIAAQGSAGDAYVTQTYHSGSNWYRVWSDGFIEQGGLKICKQGGNATNAQNSLSLLKSFTSTNYLVLLGLNSEVTSGVQTPKVDTVATYGAKTTSGFILNCFDGNNSDSDTEVSWYACGY